MKKTQRSRSRKLGHSAILLAAAVILGCGANFWGKNKLSTKAGLLDEINALRAKSDLPPLIHSDKLEAAAEKRAAESAEKGRAEPADNRMPALIEAGAFARFALSHEVRASSFNEAAMHIVNDTLSKSKLLHPSLTHAGIGVEKKKGGTYLVVDLARLTAKADLKKAISTLRKKMDEKRARNSLAPLTINDNMSIAASKAAELFMSTTVSSDEIMAKTQAGLKGDTFAFGRMTVNLQTAATLEQATVPERTADPALEFAGIGIAQGNRDGQEAGALAVVLILAEPQTAHKQAQKISGLPAPKAAPRSKISKKKPFSEQAWTATLTGNHKKAARLFEKAYRQTKKSTLMYEAARAHARNGDIAAAKKDMRQYAEMSDGAKKQKALDMLDKLEKGKSIFSTSTADRMSVEAKRFFVMGQLLFEEKEWEGAVDAFQQAYKFSPTPEIVYNIGLAHYRAGRIGDALDFFGEYRRLAPSAANVEEARQLFEIGVELYQNGRFEAASRQFAMAYSFLPFPELVFNLGLCYKALGENDKAVRFFREYLEKEPPKKEREEARKIITELLSGKKP